MDDHPIYPLYSPFNGALNITAFSRLATAPLAVQAERLNNDKAALNALRNVGTDFLRSYNDYCLSVVRDVRDTKPLPGWFWYNGDNAIFYLIMVTPTSAVVAPVSVDYEEAYIAANEYDYLVPDEPTVGANTAVLLSLAREVLLQQVSRLYPLGPLYKPWNLELHAAYARLHGKQLAEFNIEHMGMAHCDEGIEPRFVARKLADARMNALETGAEFSEDIWLDVEERRARRKAALRAPKEAPVYELFQSAVSNRDGLVLAAASKEIAEAPETERMEALLRRFPSPCVFSVIVALDTPTGFSRSPVVSSCAPLILSVESQKAEISKSLHPLIATLLDDYRPALRAAEVAAARHMLALPDGVRRIVPEYLGKPDARIEGPSAGLAVGLASFAALMPAKVHPLFPSWIGALGELDAQGNVRAVGHKSEKLSFAVEVLKLFSHGSGLILVAPGETNGLEAPTGVRIVEVATLDQAISVVWGQARLNEISASEDLNKTVTALEKLSANSSDHARTLALSDVLLAAAQRYAKADPSYQRLQPVWRLHVLRLRCFDHTGRRDQAAESRRAAAQALNDLSAARGMVGAGYLGKLPPKEATAVIDLLAHGLQSQHADEFDFESDDAKELLRQLDAMESEHLDDDGLLRVHGARVGFHRYRYIVDRAKHPDSLAELRRLWPLYEQAAQRDTDPGTPGRLLANAIENDVALLSGAELRGTLKHFRDYHADVESRKRSANFCLLHGGTLARELAFAGIPLLAEDRARLLSLLELCEQPHYSFQIGMLGLAISDWLAENISDDEFDVLSSECVGGLISSAKRDGVALIMQALAAKSALMIAKATLIRRKAPDLDIAAMCNEALQMMQKVNQTAQGVIFFGADCEHLKALVARLHKRESVDQGELTQAMDSLASRIRY